MIVCTVKNISSKTKSILSAFLYEIDSNIFVGTVNPSFFKEMINKLNIKNREKVIIITENKKAIEGFDIYYLNCPSKIIDFDGLKFFRP